MQTIEAPERIRAEEPAEATDRLPALRSGRRLGLALTGLLAAAVLWSLLTGAYELSAKEIVIIMAAALGAPEVTAEPAAHHLLLHIRLPRILMGGLVGAALATSGAAIQGLFRNPLADPSLIGITSGGMLFAVTGIFFSSVLVAQLPAPAGQAAVSLFAFAGSLLTTWLVYHLATYRGHTSVVTMLLAGIALTALAGAGVGLLSYFSDEAQLRDITFWTLGSMAGGNWRLVLILGPAVLLSLWMLCRQARALDALMLGEREAAYLGAPVQRTKRIVILFSSLAVGVAVSVSGVIAFVALVAPHLLRLLGGPRHSSLLVNAGLAGALLIVAADTVARTLIAPAELPIGTLTALLGAPFFLWLLLRYRGGESSFH